jgi:hypothetical protein
MTMPVPQRHSGAKWPRKAELRPSAAARRSRSASGRNAPLRLAAPRISGNLARIQAAAARSRGARNANGTSVMSGQEGGGETKIKRLGDAPPADDTLDDISTQLIRDKSNQIVGKLTVIEGPGTGNSVKVFSGTNQIGRGDDMRVQINFGDHYISRQQHAVLTFDAASKEARIYDGAKPGGVFLNGTKLSADQAIRFGDTIKLGDTTLRFETP